MSGGEIIDAGASGNLAKLKGEPLFSACAVVAWPFNFLDFFAYLIHGFGCLILRLFFCIAVVLWWWAEVKEKVGDDKEFRRICDVVCVCCTGQKVLHRAAKKGHLKICEFLIENVGVQIDVLTYRGSLSLSLNFCVVWNDTLYLMF